MSAPCACQHWVNLMAGTIETLQVIRSNEKPSQGIPHNNDYAYELNIFT